jgi:hypothetical protein
MRSARPVVAAAAVTLTTLLAVSGCSHTATVVNGTGVYHSPTFSAGPSPTTAAGSPSAMASSQLTPGLATPKPGGPSGGTSFTGTVPGGAVSAELIGGPLTAADVPGWHTAAVPADTRPTLVDPCGKPTGVQAFQQTVDTSALTTPTGISVITRVAGYASPGARAAAIAAASAALSDCPSSTSAVRQVTTNLLTDPSTLTEVGVTIDSTTAGISGVSETEYWMAGTADGTVEVRVSAFIPSAAETDPLPDFSEAVLAAAQSKALGLPVGALTAPVLTGSPATGTVVGTATPGTRTTPDPDESGDVAPDLGASGTPAPDTGVPGASPINGYVPPTGP